MCLYATDLQDAGHRVDKALVHPSALEAAAAATHPDVELLVLDAVFPFAMVRRLKELTGLPILVGGHNALQHMLRGPADFGIVGPGRRALTAFVAGQPHAEIPGLWFRDAEGRLDCGQGSDKLGNGLATELEPFEPDADWDYFGPPRAPGSNRRIPSIVADFGCVWNRSILGAEGEFKPFAGVSPRLPDVAMTAQARSVVESQFVASEGGCSFCVLRYSKRSGASVDAVLDSLVSQARHHLRDGAHGLSLQTEHPLPFLTPLLDRLEEQSLTAGLDELHIRTIPWLILRHSSELSDAIQRSRELGIQLVLGQVGFEAFDPLSMELFHKGLSVEDNRAAARLLSQLEAEHTPHFRGTVGHGFILLHPWTRPADLRTNLEACRSDAPWLLPSFSPDRRVELYAEWSPLFWKAQDEGVLRPAPDGFGWDWQFADPGTGEIVAAASSLLAGRLDKSHGQAAQVFDQVLSIWEAGLEPEERRARYLALRHSHSLHGDR